MNLLPKRYHNLSPYLYVLFILGCLGWIKLVNKLQADLPTKIIFSLIIYRPLAKKLGKEA